MKQFSSDFTNISKSGFVTNEKLAEATGKALINIFYFRTRIKKL